MVPGLKKKNKKQNQVGTECGFGSPGNGSGLDFTRVENNDLERQVSTVGKVRPPNTVTKQLKCRTEMNAHSELLGSLHTAFRQQWKPARECKGAVL